MNTRTLLTAVIVGVIAYFAWTKFLRDKVL